MGISLGDVFIFLKGNKSHLTRTLGTAESEVRSFGQRVNSGLKESLGRAFEFAVGGVIQQGINSIVGSLQGLARTGFDAVGANERLGLSLESLVAGQLRAADASITMSQALAAAGPIARDLAEFVNELAIKSPFSTEGVAKALQTASAYGFSTEQAKRLTQATIDMAAATGGSTETMNGISLALGQVQAKGKASAEELNQLRERGAPVQQALDSIGASLDDVSNGLVSADTFINALIGTMEDNFAGAAERMATSWSGLASTFGDITRIGLREFFQGILEPLQPLAAKLADVAGSKEAASTIRELGQAIGDVLRPGVEWLTGALEVIPTKLRDLATFIRAVRDDLAGETAGSIMSALGPAIDAARGGLQNSLDTLAQAHRGSLAQINEDIQAAGQTAGAALAAVAEEYAPKIADIQDRFARSIRDSQEKITDAAAAQAKKRADYEQQIFRSQQQAEEKLTELKRDHQERRQNLAKSLMFAEDEMQYLQIQEQIRQEDTKFQEQTAQAKDANQEQVTDLQARLAEEETAYQQQNERLKRGLQEQQADRDKQLSRVLADQAEETAAVEQKHAAAVAALQARIDAENAAYGTQTADLRASTDAAIAGMEESYRSRAEAVGQGFAGTVAGWIQSLVDGFNSARATVTQFIDEAMIPLQASWTALADGWNNQLGPALTNLDTAIKNLTGGANLWEIALGGIKGALDLLAPVIETSIWMTTQQVNGVTALVDGLKSLAEWFGKLPEKIDEFTNALAGSDAGLPGWMRPGSPTPLELGIRGISDALNKMPDLAGAFAGPQVAAGSLAGAVGGMSLSFNQVNNLGTAPAGFDGQGLINEIQMKTQQMIVETIRQVFEGQA